MRQLSSLITSWKTGYCWHCLSVNVADRTTVCRSVTRSSVWILTTRGRTRWKATCSRQILRLRKPSFSIPRLFRSILKARVRLAVWATSWSSKASWMRLFSTTRKHFRWMWTSQIPWWLLWTPKLPAATGKTLTNTSKTWCKWWRCRCRKENYPVSILSTYSCLTFQVSKNLR